MHVYAVSFFYLPSLELRKGQTDREFILFVLLKKVLLCGFKECCGLLFGNTTFEDSEFFCEAGKYDFRPVEGMAVVYTPLRLKYLRLGRDSQPWNQTVDDVTNNLGSLPKT